MLILYQYKCGHSQYGSCWGKKLGSVCILQDLTGFLTEVLWSQLELSNQISALQYGFKRMRLIGFPGWTLVITSTMGKSLNMSNASARTSVFKERPGTRK